MKVQLFGRWKALDMHARRDEAHRVHRDAMGQQRRQGDLEVDAAGSQERHRVAPIGVADCDLVRGQVRRRHQPGFSQINADLFGFLPRVSRTNLSSLIRRRRGIRRQKADLLRRMVTRIPETIIFCHALNVSANKNNRTTRSHAGWVRERVGAMCPRDPARGEMINSCLTGEKNT